MKKRKKAFEETIFVEVVAYTLFSLLGLSICFKILMT